VFFAFQTDSAESDANAKITEALVKELQQQITELKSKLEALTAENFCLNCFAGSDGNIKFYNGFPSYSIFCTFYVFLGPAVSQLNYCGADFKDDHPSGRDKRGPTRKLQPIDELFLVLYRLRCNPLEKDIGDRFGLHPSSISRIIITWIKLKQLPIWPSRQTVDDTMPACFKAHYPKTRVIIDCKEIFIQMPSHRCTHSTKVTIQPKGWLEYLLVD